MFCHHQLLYEDLTPPHDFSFIQQENNSTEVDNVKVSTKKRFVYYDKDRDWHQQMPPGWLTTTTTTTTTKRLAKAGVRAPAHITAQRIPLVGLLESMQLPAGTMVRTSQQRVLQHNNNNNNNNNDDDEVEAVPQPYMYMTSKLSSISKQLQQQLHIDQLTVQHNNNIINNNNNHPPQVNLWAGSAGVTATTHYDIEYNFFLQSFGRKRFILLPPEQHHNMYLQSSLHPQWRQSQATNINNSKSLRLYPLLHRAVAQEVVLEPGDLLFIPPFHLHSVQALTPAISVNVWSMSPEYMLSEEMLTQVNLPFDYSWGKDKCIFIGRLYIKYLLNNIFNNNNNNNANNNNNDNNDVSHQFIARMLSSRYFRYHKIDPTINNNRSNRLRPHYKLCKQVVNPTPNAAVAEIVQQLQQQTATTTPLQRLIVSSVEEVSEIIEQQQR